MNMRALLFVQAALLPAAALATLVLLGGVLLRGALLSSVDESLNSMAAVEMISLFDSAPIPHLHLGRSPLRSQVEAFAPSGAVYAQDGRLVVSEITTAPVVEQLAAKDRAGADQEGQVWLRTVSEDGMSIRELGVGMLSPERVPYTLILRSSLEALERTVRTYYRVLGIGAALVSLGFMVVQARVSRWWAERIRNMIRHTRRLEAGDLSSRPTPDPNRDEIGELVAAIARASARLEEARRMQDRLVADAAHELRTPLAAIRAEIDVTLRRPRSADSLRAALEAVREEVDRLSELSTRLLDMARWRSDTQRLETVDLARVLHEVVESRRSAALASGLRLDSKVPSDASARVEEAAVRQMIGNLLDNAIKFSPSGGVVQLELTRDERRWRLVVSDEGPGVPEDERCAIFEPFHRLDARISGAGLGLAIVREVARAHQGDVWVEPSALGARFVFEAPCEPNREDPRIGHSELLSRSPPP